MAVKKKAAAKKVAKKKVVKKAVAKKAPAKKKSAAKKATKKATKKAPAKRVAKKAPAKKKVAAKKVAKKATKKSPTKKSTSASKVVIPPVPLGGSNSSTRVNVTTTPAPVKQAPAKPSSAPKQSTSPRVLIAAVIGIALLAIVVISRPASDSDIAAPAVTPSATESAAPEVTEEPTPEAVAAVEAPGRFIGNWKDSTNSVMVITWRAPAATAGLTGYKFETRSGMGEWTEAGTFPATQLSVELTKESADSSTSFRVSSIYSDGQIATAKAFGFAGQFA
uniref:histone H1-like repetitive region-containing protein n=1 Tax=Candidatus Planktophila sp. TaxID=2175601 RepID=UPI00404B1455